MVRGRLRRPPVRHALDRLTGLIVIGFGPRPAVRRS